MKPRVKMSSKATNSQNVDEEERIRTAYRKRLHTGYRGYYSWFNTGTAFHLQQQERALLSLLKRHGLTDLRACGILEVGCGGGSELANFVKYGADPGGLHGIDLLPERVEACRRRLPTADVREGNAAELPFADDSFDIVCQFVMFTSILDMTLKQRIAAEMRRVTKPGGIIIWYDYLVSRPDNDDVSGIGLPEITRLFPGCGIDSRRVSLAPPLARVLAPRSWLLAYLLGMLPFLRTHYLAAIRPAAS